MSRERTGRDADQPTWSGGAAVQAHAPGKRTLTEALQRSSRGAAAIASPDPIAVAERGTTGGGGTLPYLDTVQASFGTHDVSGIRSFVGGGAAEASHALGANAYAVGDAVGFGSAPSLHTAAHEAAHVVQQRAGVQLEGGIDGGSGDPHERHADAVADAVVAGESAQSLLDLYSGGGGGTGAVQRHGAMGPQQQKQAMAAQVDAAAREPAHAEDAGEEHGDHLAAMAGAHPELEDAPADVQGGDDQAAPAQRPAAPADDAANGAPVMAAAAKFYAALQASATKNKTPGLFDFFMKLAPDQQIRALVAASGKPEAKLTDKVMKGISWKKLALAMRELQTENKVKDHTKDSNKDYVEYTRAGLAGADTATTAGVSSLAAGYNPLTHATRDAGTLQHGVEVASHGKIDGASWTPGASAAGQGISNYGAMIGAPLGIVDGMFTVGNSLDRMQGGDTGTKAEQGAKAGAGLGDIVTSSSKTALAANNFGGAASQAASVTAVGAGAIVAGAGYMVSGGVGAYQNHKRQGALEEIARREATPPMQANPLHEGEAEADGGLLDDELGHDLSHTALMGADAASVNKKVAGATAVKGALMVAGGVMLLVAATNPIGWTLLAGAALIGGIAAMKKYLAKSDRRKMAVDRELGLDHDEYKAPKGSPKGAQKKLDADLETERTKRLNARGFADYAQMYQAILDGAAKHLAGVLRDPTNPQYATVKEIVQNLGLKVPADPSKLPTADRIAIKLKG